MLLILNQQQDKENERDKFKKIIITVNRKAEDISKSHRQNRRGNMKQIE